jgi:anhydro-N-acetylmuramic acid kinase
MEPIWALGAMSGTSLDGVDAAMLRTDGVTIAEFGDSGYRPYTAAERGVLRAALGAWQDEARAAAAAEVVVAAHAALMGGFSGAALAGFHGQTLAHDPKGRGTHQAGDGSVLAQALGLPVVWDFRSADVALGGEGAPLAPAYHFACAKWMGTTAPVAFLNLGGVGNLTWVNPLAARVEEEGAVLAFDTGPANAPMDDLMVARGAGDADIGGALALTGRVDQAMAARAMAHGFFAKMPPKSLDRNSLQSVLDVPDTMPLADALATLVDIVARSVALALTFCPQPPTRLLVTGGGRHNAAVMAALERLCAAEVMSVDSVGLDGDMLEAQAFAYLAVRVKRGLATSFPQTTGGAAQVGGGQISRP